LKSAEFLICQQPIAAGVLFGSPRSPRLRVSGRVKLFTRRRGERGGFVRVYPLNSAISWFCQQAIAAHVFSVWLVPELYSGTHLSYEAALRRYTSRAELSSLPPRQRPHGPAPGPVRAAYTRPGRSPGILKPAPVALNGRPIMPRCMHLPALRSYTPSLFRLLLSIRENS